MTHKGALVPSTANQLTIAAQAREVYWNLGRSELVEWSVREGEGELSADGALVARTGEFTGRSPNDKFIVKDSSTLENVDWGSVNQAISEEHAVKFEALRSEVLQYKHEKE